MATKEKSAKRLRLKPGCSVMGLIERKTLGPGLYIRGKNVPEEVFDKLLEPEFSHAVEQLPDTPPAERLAEVSDTPKEDPGAVYRRKLRDEERAKYLERWPAGRPTQTSSN